MCSSDLWGAHSDHTGKYGDVCWVCVIPSVDDVSFGAAPSTATSIRRSQCSGPASGTPWLSVPSARVPIGHSTQPPNMLRVALPEPRRASTASSCIVRARPDTRQRAAGRGVIGADTGREPGGIVAADQARHGNVDEIRIAEVHGAVAVRAPHGFDNQLFALNRLRMRQVELREHVERLDEPDPA